MAHGRLIIRLSLEKCWQTAHRPKTWLDDTKQDPKIEKMGNSLCVNCFIATWGTLGHFHGTLA